MPPNSSCILPSSSFLPMSDPEKILFETRQHLLILLNRLIFMIFQSILFVFADFGLISLFSIEPLWPFIIAGLLILIGFGVSIYPWLMTTLTITNQRVIIRKQTGLFHNELLAANLNKIRETAIKMDGLGAALKFGSITIMSDLELSNKQLKIDNIPNLNELKIYLDKILNLVAEKTPKEDLPEFPAETVKTNSDKNATDIAI